MWGEPFSKSEGLGMFFCLKSRAWMKRVMNSRFRLTVFNGYLLSALNL